MTAFGGILMVGGFVMLGAALLSLTRAWRNGLPWWSGGPIWWSAAAQPPAARPHMRATLHRFATSVLCHLASIAVFALAEQ